MGMNADASHFIVRGVFILSAIVTGKTKTI